MNNLLAAKSIPDEKPRLFVVHNETAQHAVELEATSHGDAARLYREKHQTQGYARIQTSDAEVLFSLRAGTLHQVHHTYGPEGPQRRPWQPHFAPARTQPVTPAAPRA